MNMPIAILGAGVAGLCVATELVARGVPVTLHDPAGGPGAHGCSWWAGGMLAPFCEYENADETILIKGKTALNWWAAHTTVTRAGTLVVAQPRDRHEIARFAARTEDCERLDAAGISVLEPDLGTRFPTGLFFASEGHLDPRQALADLASALANRGVPIRRDAPPQGARLIDCRGLAARDALPGLRGVRGEMALIRSADVDLRRPVRLLHPRIPLYIVPRGDGVFMLGATMIESEARGPVTLRSALELLSAAYALSPAFGEAEILEFGTDLRPAFADNMPRVQERDGITYINGLYRHGYLMAPAFAQEAAAVIATQTGVTNEACH